MKKLFYFPFLIVLIAGVFYSCDKDGDINVFSIKDDKELGAQLKAEIESNPSEYPLLKESEYPDAYKYIQEITDRILNSGQVQYKDEFAWEVKIIHDDNVLNAFCAPGGYIYVYTGIIKYLENEYELAGVMGHEIAHADHRHSTDQMTKQYGLSLLFDVVLGKTSKSTIGQMAQGLITLKYGRNDEKEADSYSVQYLCPTDYQADGAAVFFEKIVEEGGSGTPTFLSTHPDPGSRVEAIRTEYQDKGCSGSRTLGDYEAFKASLPK